MRKLLYYYLALIATVIYSCQDENSGLGQSLVESSFQNAFIDTCTVDISTIYIDSLETMGDSICQLGYYKDSEWGEVTSSYYAEYSVNSFTPVADHSYKYDSLVLRMTPSGHYWGDTLVQQRISVYRLKYAIDLDDDKELYNHSSLETETTPLFSFTFHPRPGHKKELEIRMPDEWGETLFADLIAEKDVFDSQEKFKAYFHGLAFVPEAPGECITGFLANDSSMNITLHYQDIAGQRTEKELTFSVNTEYSFTGITHERNNTPLATLEAGIENALSSRKTGNRAYMQGLTGLYNQIEFPYLNTLEELGDIVSVENAMLYLYPLAGSYGKYSQLPSELRLYITNENNVLEDYVYGNDGVTVQTGNLVVDEAFGRDTYYSFDVTTFVQNNLGTWGINRQKLLMSMPDEESSTTFNQVIFTNEKEEERQCRLDIRYKIYNKK